MERLALFGSSFFYLFSCCSTLIAFKARDFRPRHFSFAAIVLGLLCQSWFLILRGGSEIACPIRTLPEILIFLSWSIGIFYIVIGSSYRISLMGIFTAPLILALQLIALFLPSGRARADILHNPWVETHAALSLIAFGAFGLACVAGLMFLVQEKELNSQYPAPIFHHLPPIRLLEKVTARLLWLGLVLLTISFTAGFVASLSISGIKFWISLFVLGSYLLLVVMHQRGHVSAHRLALFAVMIFILALIALPGIQYLSLHFPLR